MLENYYHPKKKTKVKKVLLIVSEGALETDPNGRERVGEYADFGTKGVKHQFKRSKGHKGQILYYDEKGSIKVMPVYSNKKLSDVKDVLLKSGCKLYNKGQIFYSGCLIKTKETFEASVYYSVLDKNGKEKKISNKEILPIGIYKIRTIMSDGTIKMENNNGVEILTSAAKLANAKFHRYQY
jgi:hypothetical protein